MREKSKVSVCQFVIHSPLSSILFSSGCWCHFQTTARSTIDLRLSYSGRGRWFVCIYIKVGFVYIYLYFIFISILHVNKNTAASVETGGGINWIARAWNIVDGHKFRGEGAKRRTTINCRFVLVHDTSNNYKVIERDERKDDSKTNTKVQKMRNK